MKELDMNEVIKFNQMFKNPEFSTPVIKFLENILNAGVFGKRFKVLTYLLDHRTTKDIVITTQREIAENTGLSLTTVAKAINVLKNNKIIKQVNKGIYQVDSKKIFPENCDPIDYDMTEIDAYFNNR